MTSAAQLERTEHLAASVAEYRLADARRRGFDRAARADVKHRNPIDKAAHREHVRRLRAEMTADRDRAISNVLKLAVRTGMFTAAVDTVRVTRCTRTGRRTTARRGAAHASTSASGGSDPDPPGRPSDGRRRLAPLGIAA